MLLQWPGEVAEGNGKQQIMIDERADADQRTALRKILHESTGTPIIHPHSGQPSRSRIDLPGGFEYSVAEMGNGTTTAHAGLTLNLSNSYGQFNILHVNQDGVIRT